MTIFWNTMCSLIKLYRLTLPLGLFFFQFGAWRQWTFLQKVIQATLFGDAEVFIVPASGHRRGGKTMIHRGVLQISGVFSTIRCICILDCQVKTSSWENLGRICMSNREADRRSDQATARSGFECSRLNCLLQHVFSARPFARIGRRAEIHCGIRNPSS